MKRIYLTVDTECHDFKRLNQYIYGKTQKGEYGLKCILEIGKKHNIPINIFLDIPECNAYGNDYIQDIINLVKSYNQKIYFHFHPNYKSNDERSYLWEYSEKEQEKLLNEGFEEYYAFCGKGDKVAFRAGRYGVDKKTYKILSQQDIPVIDFSYCANRPKMCHLSDKDVSTQNRPIRFEGVVLQPNTSYVGFDYFNIKKNILLGVTDTTFNEFSRIIRTTKLNSITYCMHSWSLMDKWFFLKNYVGGNRSAIKRMEKCIEEAKRNGYVFSEIDSFEYIDDSYDELQDLCSSFSGKIYGIGNNFLRFQRMAKINKKYFAIYALFYFAIILIITFCIVKFLG